MTPTSTQHLMVDIEAAGQSTSAALVSIGATFFNPWTGEMGAQFYLPIKLTSSQYFGGDIDASTMNWWMKQSDEVRAVFNDEARVGLKDGLNQFKAFIEQHSKQDEVHVWGNGPAYDNAIFQAQYVSVIWQRLFSAHQPQPAA